MGLIDFGGGAGIPQQASGPPQLPSPAGLPPGGGGGSSQINAQLLTLIMELLRRAQAQGQGQGQGQGQQATPPSLDPSTLLSGAFPPVLPTQGTSPLGGLGNRQGLFTQTVQAPSQRDQIAAALASVLRNTTNARARTNQGRP
jgi:hypothetical protein